MTVQQITAEELRTGDIWLGDGGGRLRVTAVSRYLEQFRPWVSSRTAIPVPMMAVTIFGTLEVTGREPFTGYWTLQPDMPIEVLRGVTHERRR